LKPGAAWYAFYSDTQTRPVLDALDLLGSVKHILVWVKERLVFGRCDYHYQHELIGYGWTPGAAHTWVGPHNLTTVLNVSRDNAVAKSLHPTVKPVDVLIIPINNHLIRGLILEPFGGSGSTVAAAEQTANLCNAMEYDPKYVAVTLERLSGMGLTPSLQKSR